MQQWHISNVSLDMNSQNVKSQTRLLICTLNVIAIAFFSFFQIMVPELPRDDEDAEQMEEDAADLLARQAAAKAAAGVTSEPNLSCLAHGPL
jgi:hypothetical protein